MSKSVKAPQVVSTIHYGPMKSGKSLKLIQLAFDLRNKGVPYLAFKPALDTRDGPQIQSRSHTQKIKAHQVLNACDIVSILQKKPVAHILIDEVMLFDAEIFLVLDYCKSEGISLDAAGLDRNFKREFFILPVNEYDASGRKNKQDYDVTMADLILEFDKHFKLAAICDVCGGAAYYTQKLIGGQPAPFDSPDIEIGDAQYEARCIDCYERG